MSRKSRSVLLTVLVITTLVAAALLVSSCGSKTATTTSQAGSTQMTGKTEIDNFLRQLDQDMSSVPADSEFNDSQLDNNQLGI
ncbi:MAG: hypothetical protein ACYC99_13715 [Candidatus Geothermincolia bacterium]